MSAEQASLLFVAPEERARSPETLPFNNVFPRIQLHELAIPDAAALQKRLRWIGQPMEETPFNQNPKAFARIIAGSFSDEHCGAILSPELVVAVARGLVIQRESLFGKDVYPTVQAVARRVYAELRFVQSYMKRAREDWTFDQSLAICREFILVRGSIDPLLSNETMAPVIIKVKPVEQGDEDEDSRMKQELVKASPPAQELLKASPIFLNPPHGVKFAKDIWDYLFVNEYPSIPLASTPQDQASWVCSLLRTIQGTRDYAKENAARKERQEEYEDLKDQVRRQGDELRMLTRNVVDLTRVVTVLSARAVPPIPQYPLMKAPAAAIEAPVPPASKRSRDEAKK